LGGEIRIVLTKIKISTKQKKGAIEIGVMGEKKRKNMCWGLTRRH